VPKNLARELPEHEVRTAPQMGWGDLDDGPLLIAMSGDFDALITVDRNLRYQQNLRDRPFGVVVLRAKSNRITDLLALMPRLRDVLGELRPGEVREVDNFKEDRQ
jgi:hypothetical protein